MAFTTTYFAMEYSSAKDVLIVLATVDQFDRETAYTTMQTYNVAKGGWGKLELDGLSGTAIGLEEVAGSRRLWLTGDSGAIWLVEGGKVISQAQLPDSGLEGRQLGQPNDVRRIDGRMYICGFAGQVYTLAGAQWVHMDAGLAEPTGTPESIDLESIDGTSASDIYTVGSGGLVAHWDGRQWTRVSVPTNVYLARVRCFAKDRIVVVGNKGVVIESDGAAWPVDRIPGAEETPLSDVALFQDRLYVAALGKLFVKDGDRWVEVKHGLPKDKTQFVRLLVGGGRLWAMGAKRVNSFDGKAWTAHPDTNNG